MIKHMLILIVACGLAFGVTIPKLNKMRMIRGMKPGATTTQEVITQKWIERHDWNPKRSDAYWVAWTDRDIRSMGSHRMNLQPEMWQQFDIGDTIEVTWIPGDNHPYHRDGIFAEDWHFYFDYALLAAELGTALVMLILIVLALTGRRSAGPTDLRV